jgi:hypothetical protein
VVRYENHINMFVAFFVTSQKVRVADYHSLEFSFRLWVVWC